MRDGFGLIEAILYLVAAISGGLGASVIAGHHVLRGRALTVAMVLAYLAVGSVFGVLALAYSTLLGFPPASLDELVRNCIFSGAAASIALASTNMVIRLVLRRLGVEVEVTLRHRNEDRRNRRD